MEKFGKEKWVEMFKEIGLTEVQMTQWHKLFETRNPQKHQEFLKWLGIDDSEIEAIRNRE